MNPTIPTPVRLRWPLLAALALVLSLPQAADARGARSGRTVGWPVLRQARMLTQAARAYLSSFISSRTGCD